MIGKNKDKKLIRILFVCSGNVIRSAIAEMVFEKIITEKYGENWRSVIQVASGAVKYKNSKIFDLTEHYLLSEGIEKARIKKFRPRHIEEHPELFAEADLILTMTQEHIDRILAYNPSYASKTVLITEFSDKQEVPDPWFSRNQENALQQAAAKIKISLQALLKKLEKEEILA